ncbi:flagellar export protein FliJ [Thalassolituus oleivorans]|uniref:flagellar export protein FliJ n=1 Tax=Thalassolituus oleivorans TaxID=187493 RepID=UPI00042DD29E|nr:flagellar export protein FliJ [Thalassolituus oleivorans]AHK17406.1 hypothetical protein R615_05120 [Thalassolituus oleivorans R6-15]
MRYRHPRARRLAVVLELAEKDEKEALRRWGDSQKKLVLEEERQQQLTVYAADYQKQIATPSSGHISAGMIHNTLGFISQIETALNQQQEQIKRLRAQTERARDAYLKSHGKVQAMQQLLQRLEQEFEHEQDRQQQREADEWATRNAAIRPKSR